MRIVKPLIFVIIGWYLLLITLHYFNQRPLWNDEECVFFSIQQKTPFAIFHTPLLNLQQFPKLYLYAIQQFAVHFDFHLLALRFFPFVCMFMAFLVWCRIAQAELGQGIFLLTFLGCWVASIPLIYYAAELKQYSMDVLAGAVFIFILQDYKRLERWYWALPFFGLFSYPAFLFLVLPWYSLLKKKDFKRLTFYTLICLSVAGIVYCFDIRVSNVGAISEYWQDHFISFASWESFFKTLGQNFDNLMSRWFAERPKWIRMCARAIIPIGFLQLLLGFWKTFKKDKFMFSSVNSIAFVVFMEHLILGALHKYPFVVVRTSLFFAPMLLLLTVQGFSWLGSRQKYAYNIIQYLFLVYLGYISIGIARLILGGDLGAQAVLWQ